MEKNRETESKPKNKIKKSLEIDHNEREMYDLLDREFKIVIPGMEI